MPIFIKDYVWTEDVGTVYIEIPLNGAKKSSVDIFLAKEYIKVNLPPYIFDAILYDEINDTTSTATFKDGSVTLTLQKCKPILWNRLLSSLYIEDKQFVKKKRNDALQYAHSKALHEADEQATKKSERSRYTVKEQMHLEEKERQRIEIQKENERKKFLLTIDTTGDNCSKVQHNNLNENNKQGSGLVDSCAAVSRRIPDKPYTGEKQRMNDIPKRKNEIFRHEDNTVIPAPRTTGHIKVTFTPRIFPTPSRESNAAQEEEWLRKQAEARRIADGIDDPDLTEDEKNPVWLKQKADGFYKAGNFYAAINAYSLGIRLTPRNPVLLTNRAACHLKLGNMHKCIEDASEALDLLVPPVPSNAKSRLLAHVRRGTAFCALELYVEGLMDYEAGLKLDPQNEKLQDDANKIRRVIEGKNES